MVYIGIDLGGTSVKVGLVDENGKILVKESCPTLVERGAEPVINDMANLSLKVIEKAGYTLDDVKAIGIASTMIREAEGHDAVALAQELGAYLEARNLPRDGIAKEFDAKIPGLAEVNAEIETANEEYLQVHSAASAVRGVMAGKQGRHFVDIMAPAETNETAGE